MHAASLHVTVGGPCHAVLLWTEGAAGKHVERMCDPQHKHACLLMPQPQAVCPGEHAVQVELKISPTTTCMMGGSKKTAGKPGGVSDGAGARDALRGCHVAWNVELRAPDKDGAGAEETETDTLTETTPTDGHMTDPEAADSPSSPLST